MFTLLIHLIFLSLTLAASFSRVSRSIGGRLYDRCVFPSNESDAAVVKLLWDATKSANGRARFALEISPADRLLDWVSVGIKQQESGQLLDFLSFKYVPVDGLFEIVDPSSSSEPLNGSERSLLFVQGSMDNPENIASLEIERSGSFEWSSLGSGGTEQLVVALLSASANATTIQATAIERLQTAQGVLISEIDAPYCQYQDEAPLAPLAEACTGGEVRTGAVRFDDRLALLWTVNCDTETITFELISEGIEGWASVGLSASNQAMAQTDVYMARSDDASTAVVEDRWAEAQAEPIVDTQQDVLAGSVAVEINGDRRTLKFTRPLDTGDVDQDVAVTPGSPSYVLWAYNLRSSDFASQHTHRGAVAVPLFGGNDLADDLRDGTLTVAPGASGSAETASIMRLAHGAFMLLGWIVLAPSAAFIARFMKDLGHRWYVLHRNLNATVGVLTVTGTVLMVVAIWLGGGVTHFSNPHAIIGLAISVAVLLQIVFGVLANRMWSPDRVDTPIFPDKLHWILGRLLLLAGLANCFLGVAQMLGGLFVTPVLPQIVVLVAVAVPLVVYFMNECTVGQVNHNNAAVTEAPSIYATAGRESTQSRSRSNSRTSSGKHRSRGGSRRSSRPGSRSRSRRQSVSGNVRGSKINAMSVATSAQSDPEVQKKAKLKTAQKSTITMSVLVTLLSAATLILISLKDIL